MKTHDELMAMSEEEKEQYLSDEVQKLLDQVEDGPRKQRLAGMQWKIQGLKKTKYRDDPLGLCIEISRIMVDNLGQTQTKLLELKNILDSGNEEK